jgi:hypothetical protein
MGNTNKPWLIDNMPLETRRKLKIYAAQNGLTIPQALDRLADLGLKQPK